MSGVCTDGHWGNGRRASTSCWGTRLAECGPAQQQMSLHLFQLVVSLEEGSPKWPQKDRYSRLRQPGQPQLLSGCANQLRESWMADGGGARRERSELLNKHSLALTAAGRRLQEMVT